MPATREAIRRLSDWRPLIVDESDGTLDAYRPGEGVRLSRHHSKNCKGPVRAS